MPENSALWRYLYPLLASLAGALAALSFQAWDKMSSAQIALNIVAGTAFGYFVYPLVFRGLEQAPQMAGAVCFLMSAGWFSVLPLMIKKLFGDGEVRR